MSRRQLEFFDFLSSPLTVFQFILSTVLNKKQALILLTGLTFTACTQHKDMVQEAAGEEVPFSIEEVPADAPVRYVTVTFPLDWEPTTVAAREYKGYLVYEDIILGAVGEISEADEMTVRAQAAPSSDGGGSWKNTVITYSIDTTTTDAGLPAGISDTIRDAGDYYNRNTVVRWMEADAGTQGMVTFISNGVRDAGSSSGNTTLKSDGGVIYGATIKLSDGASISTVRHEMLHALGFSHEQKRPDRDTYFNVSQTSRDSYVDYDIHPIGHYDFVSKLQYDYNNNPDASGYFPFTLQDDDKVRMLFQKEARRYRGLLVDPDTTPETVQKYVGRGNNLSYLDIYALKLKYTVSNASRPFTVAAAEETSSSLVNQAKLAPNQKLLRLSIKNNSGFDAESWALRIRFGGKTLPVQLAPLDGQRNYFMTQNIPESIRPGAGRTEIITPMEGNSNIVNGGTLNVYVVVTSDTNGRLSDIAFCRLNSFDCLNSSASRLDGEEPRQAR